MKRVILIIGILCSCLHTIAQNFTAFEYFFTTDPGVGNGTAITGFPTGNTINFTANIAPPSTITPGFHHLCIRGRSATGSTTFPALQNRWSVGYSMPVIIFPASTGTANSAGINRMEFFFGNDPGFGSGNGVAISPDANGNVITPITIPSGLAAGFYMMAYRVRSNVGQWSNTTSMPMIIFPASTGTANSTAINRLEYFFGNDPGFGSGIGVNIIPDVNGNVAVPLTIPSGQLPGFYMMAYRVRTSAGQWSVTNALPFIVWSNTVNPNNSPIIQMEYFVDYDPGNGFGTDIPFSPNPSTNIQVGVNLDLTGLSLGDHIIYVRAMDSQGVWSSPKPAQITVSCANGVKLFTAQTGNWNDVATWACGRIPTSTDNVYIKALHKVTLNIGQSGSCKTIDNDRGAILDVAKGAILSIK